jgi:rSAM/selenodomain-associated transferase 1
VTPPTRGSGTGGSARSRDVLVLFAKRPDPGAVKTRMSPALTPREAADLYAAMLDDALVETSRTAERLQLAAVLSVHPPEACHGFTDHMAALDDTGMTLFRVVSQRGRDLSQRMEWAVAEAAASGARKIILRGSDCPILDATVVQNALLALDDCDVVLSPDRDGGYGLLGLREPAPELFRLEMSTPDVARETLGRASALGLRTQRLAPSFDMDTVADLVWLAEARAQGLADACPRTLAFLDQRGLWSRRAPAE